MDYRRNYGLRAPRSIGYSTYMVPQLENYTLFATPYVDLNKKLSKFIKGFKQDATDHSKTDIASGESVKRNAKKRSEEKKSEENTQELAEETSQTDLNFGIVLNVASVKPEDLTITFGDGNEIEVRVNQNDEKLSRMDITFSRDCSYKYQLPDDVDKNSLVALRTTDDYLIILPCSFLREELFNKSIIDGKGPAESSANDVVTLLETKSVDLEENKSKESDSKERKTKKGSDSKESKAKKGLDSKESESKQSESKKSESRVSESKEKLTSKTKKGSKLEGEITTVEVDSSESEVLFLSENGLIPVQVSRWLRPGMDIFMLRKYMVDLESYVSTVRNFIENASFITENSKTPELKLRALATENTDKHLERSHITKSKKDKKIVKLASLESGYFGEINSSTPDASIENTSDVSAGHTPDFSDDLSSSSSVKSGEPNQDTVEE